MGGDNTDMDTSEDSSVKNGTCEIVHESIQSSCQKNASLFTKQL